MYATSTLMLHSLILANCCLLYGLSVCQILNIKLTPSVTSLLSLLFEQHWLPWDSALYSRSCFSHLKLVMPGHLHIFAILFVLLHRGVTNFAPRKSRNFAAPSQFYFRENTRWPTVHSWSLLLNLGTCFQLMLGMPALWTTSKLSSRFSCSKKLFHLFIYLF